jgi:hypothetical protein
MTETKSAGTEPHSLIYSNTDHMLWLGSEADPGAMQVNAAPQHQPSKGSQPRWGGEPHTAQYSVVSATNRSQHMRFWEAREGCLTLLRGGGRQGRLYQKVTCDLL